MDGFFETGIKGKKAKSNTGRARVTFEITFYN